MPTLTPREPVIDVERLATLTFELPITVQRERDLPVEGDSVLVRVGRGDHEFRCRVVHVRDASNVNLSHDWRVNLSLQEVTV
jgi:hypothetical protein